ncbi:hypothetical protein ACLESD_47655 [Pyxidicoccus sp. 3LFB2]
MTSGTIRSARWLAVAALTVLSACSHGGKNEDKKGDTLCPEARELTCLSGKECAMDRERGCETCQCSRGDALTPTDRQPTGMQPDRPWR